ncbi:MAG: DUF2269 family protein [Deltaproteobacteria bacterium]|nr:DUF2269 family protein [Deltaproteobacteria bacterium]
MSWIKYLHVLALVLWFGSAAADIILELVLRKTSSREGQLTLIRLHAIIDKTLETPGFLVTLITGFFLLMKYPNPSGPLYVKIGCGLAAAAANLFCVKKVLDRDRWAKSIAKDAWPLQLERGKDLTRDVYLSMLGVPFAFVALYIAVVYF